MAEPLIILAGALLANTLLGAAVMSAIDDKQQRLFAWFDSCPPHLAPIVQPLVLNTWPIFLILWMQRDD